MRSHKGSITVVSLTLLVILSPIFLHQAFAAEQGMTLMATANAGSNTISLSGHTANPSNAISIVVTSPNGNIVTIDQVTPNANGDFATTIQTNSALWKQDGFYTVSAQQVGINGYSASAQVEIADGAVIPEFGTIAVMILAVAIISIIAVSARSKLKVLPKY